MPSSIASSTCQAVHEFHCVCCFSVRKWRRQRRDKNALQSLHLAPSPLREVGLPQARGSPPTPVPARLDPCPPTAVVAAAAVVVAAALYSFSVVSNCTIRASSSPNCSSVTSGDVYDSGHVF